MMSVGVRLDSLTTVSLAGTVSPSNTPLRLLRRVHGQARVGGLVGPEPSGDQQQPPRHAALEQDNVLPSQPTLSRLRDVLSAHQEVLREAVIEQALRRLEMSNQGRRYKRLIVDVDGLPAHVHGQQAGSEYNGYCGQRMFHALIASCSESSRHAAARRGGVGRRGA